MKTFKQYLTEAVAKEPKKTGLHYDQVNEIFKHFNDSVTVEKDEKDGSYLLNWKSDSQFSDVEDLIDFIQDYMDNSVVVSKSRKKNSVRVAWNLSFPIESEVVKSYEDIMHGNHEELIEFLNKEKETGSLFLTGWKNNYEALLKVGRLKVVCRFLEGPYKGKAFLGQGAIPKYLETYKAGDRIFARQSMSDQFTFTRNSPK